MAQSLSGLRDFFSQTSLKSSPENEIVLFPSFVHLSEAVRLAQSQVGIGGQDCSSETRGAFTGETSAESLREIGATHVLVGHSERRQRGHESPASLRAKLECAEEAGLGIVFCLGESESQRAQGRVQVEEVLRTQTEILKGLEAPFWVAYEPIWAIGTGKVPTMADIEHAHVFLNKLVPTSLGVIYGGSVKPENASEILRVSGVSGLLVGGASLKPKDFQKILESGLTSI